MIDAFNISMRRVGWASTAVVIPLVALLSACSGPTTPGAPTSAPAIPVVVADNVKLPGAPKYRAYMTAQEGRRWHTVEHETHVEYQSLLKDLVLESEYLGR